MKGKAIKFKSRNRCGYHEFIIFHPDDRDIFFMTKAHTDGVSYMRCGSNTADETVEPKVAYIDYDGGPFVEIGSKFAHCFRTNSEEARLYDNAKCVGFDKLPFSSKYLPGYEEYANNFCMIFDLHA